MSIGIAALSETKKRIVCVTDERASFKGFSSERMAQKNLPFYSDWVTLYAGRDVEYVTPILEDTLERLLRLVKTERRDPSPEEVGNALQESWWKKLEEKIEYEVLRRHKTTLTGFLSNGRKQFSTTVYNGLRNRIEQVKLSLQFMACGFDEKGNGHILVVDGSGPPGRYDTTGIFAIGTGAPAALSALAFHADAHFLSQYSELEKSIYCALEARFMAASAEDVGGESTFVTVMEKGRIQYISDLGVEAVRKIWKRSGAPRIPAQALRVIPELLYLAAEPKTADEAVRKTEAMMGKPGLVRRIKKRHEGIPTSTKPSTSQIQKPEE